MSPRFKSVLLSAIGVVVVVLAAAACQGEPDPSNAKVEVTSGQSPNASVSGTVTYRERIALTPGASLEVSLRDVSLADAAAPLIARQTISDPGQVPIEFKVEYNRDDIDSRNTYAVSARIVESDGRLAFTNDTAYDVITSGNPSKVAMVLVLVQPPPDQVDSGSDWRTWVETPVPVIWANLIAERIGAPASGRLLPVNHRGLRPPRQREPGGGRLRHRRPRDADAVAAHLLGNPLRRRGGRAGHRGAHRGVPRDRADLQGDREQPGDDHLHPACPGALATP